jgi:hypothetical protein
MARKVDRRWHAVVCRVRSRRSRIQKEDGSVGPEEKNLASLAIEKKE